jgi:hypothetical protein
MRQWQLLTMENSCHAHLDLPPDADERAIKRAYAVKLRTTRPDEDPEGFQQLNDAYQTALEMLRHRLAQEQFAGEQGTGDYGQEAPLEPAVVDETAAHALLDDVDRDSSGEPATGTIEDEAGDVADAAPQGEAITLDQFLDACLGAAGDGDPRVLEHWLRSQPVLWSLEHKAMIGHWLLRLMDARQPPMTERNFDMLAEFFGYNDLHAGYDPLALQRLRARLIEAWRELQAQRRWQRPTSEQVPASAYSFSSIAQQRQPPEVDEAREQAAYMHRLLRLHGYLTRPASTWRNLWTSLNIGRVSSVRGMLLDNPFGGWDKLPDKIRRDQIVYWLSATEGYGWTSRRIQIALFRCLMLALPAFPLLATLQLLEAGQSGLTTSMVVSSVAWPWAILMCAWALQSGFRTLLQWQSGTEPSSPGLRRVHVALVPVLAGICLVSLMFGTMWPITYASGMLGCWLATARFFGQQSRHGNSASPWLTAHRAILLLIATTLVFPFFMAEPLWIALPMAAFALGLWTFVRIKASWQR